MENRERAKELLTGENTLAIVSAQGEFTSTERGVKPLLRLLEEGTDVRGGAAADRVVGGAAAFLYVLLGVKEVFAPVMSRRAEELLLSHGIGAAAECFAERIINRRGDGPCPMESAVEGLHSPTEALEAIKRRAAELSAQEKNSEKSRNATKND